jgi:predicted GIY-YIG superfamily endonuclease
MEIRIYHLTNPKNNSIFYIGATSQTLYKRLMQHKNNWGNDTTRQLCKEKILPIITELEVCSIEIAAEREEYWIKKMISNGHPIENKIMKSYIVSMNNKKKLCKSEV